MKKQLTTADLGKLMTERAFQDQVIEHAKAAGWEVIHFNDSRRQISPGVFVGDTSAKGFPDLMLLREGVALFRELKKDNTYPKPKQREVMAAMKAAGLDVDVWRPRDFEAVIEPTLWNPPNDVPPPSTKEPWRT